MSTYKPDKWIVVEINHQGDKIQKVFGNWYGGYTGGDSWKLSSGITETVEFDDRYEYTNISGSIYICYKRCEGTSGYGASVLAKFQQDISKIENTTIEIITKPDFHKE
jgi:hypothetical protein